MKVIYIAGKFRSKVKFGTGPDQWEQEQNIRAAEEASWKVWEAGHAAICPHTNTRFFQGSLPDYIWLAGDVEILLRCDGVLLVERWQESEGTRVEKSVADKHNIPVSESINALIIMIDRQNK